MSVNIWQRWLSKFLLNWPISNTYMQGWKENDKITSSGPYQRIFPKLCCFNRKQEKKTSIYSRIFSVYQPYFVYPLKSIVNPYESVFSASSISLCCIISEFSISSINQVNLHFYYSSIHWKFCSQFRMNLKNEVTKASLVPN